MENNILCSFILGIGILIATPSIVIGDSVMNDKPCPSDTRVPENEFQPMDLRSHLNNLSSTISWTQHDKIAVKVSIEEFGQLITESHIWTAPADVYKIIQPELINIAKLNNNSTSGQYTLSIDDKYNTQKQWSSDAESVELNRVRNELELLAHLSYVKAIVYKKISEKLYTQSNVEQAMNSLKAGIEVLDDLYQSPDLIDDTGMKLVAGEENENNRDYDTAYHLYDGVLESRIDAYNKVKISSGNKIKGSDSIEKTSF